MRPLQVNPLCVRKGLPSSPPSVHPYHGNLGPQVITVIMHNNMIVYALTEHATTPYCDYEALQCHNNNHTHFMRIGRAMLHARA